MFLGNVRVKFEDKIFNIDNLIVTQGTHNDPRKSLAKTLNFEANGKSYSDILIGIRISHNEFIIWFKPTIDILNNWGDFNGHS